jgi:capsular polysaccharide biosynthesis protein
LEKLGYKRSPTQNLYITRRGNQNGRHVENESDLLKILDDYDFLFVNPSELSFKNQLELFSNANIVIGPHGAALSHVVNFPNESQVLELNGNRDVRWHIRNMCTDLNIKHTILLGKSNKNGNFEINLELVRDFLKKA